MLLKKSMYNIKVDNLPNGDILLFNSLTSAFGIMNTKTQTIYNKIEDINVDLIENKELKDSIEVLKKNGFLCESDIDEYRKLELSGKLLRYGSKNLILTIAPTINCNMACPYCYEEKTNIRMNHETENLLVKFVEKYITNNGIKSLIITWYGGEPLLEKKTITNLSEQFIEICEKNNVKYFAGIITNGALLDYDTAKVLKEKCKVSYAQITIDGLRETHNSRRVLKNGLDSFGIITDNIEACKDIIDIIIRINVDKSNIEEAEKLIDYFANERKWIDKVRYYFAPIGKQTDACNANISNCYSSTEFGNIDSKLLRKTYKNGGIKSIEMSYPRPLSTPCSATSINNFVIDPEGNLYTCWDLIGIKNASVGNIKDGPILNSEYVKWLSMELPEECHSCNLLPICQAGCPFSRLRSGNKKDCVHRTISYIENLKIVYEEHILSKTKNKTEIA